MSTHNKTLKKQNEKTKTVQNRKLNNKTQNSKLNNKTQKGGKKLGEGGFGCVVHPGISCGPGSSVEDPKQANRTISKIIPSEQNEQYQRELDIYKRIKSIDPEQRYLISYNEECKLDPSAINKRQPKDLLRVKYHDDDEYNIVENSNVIKKLGINTYNENNIDDEFCRVDEEQEPRNLVQLYGGRRLNQILKVMNTKTQDSNIMFHAKLLKSNMLSVIRDLLYGIYLMHSNKMVHRDIKYSNIVSLIGRLASTGNKYPLTRHIDFGLSQDISTMTPSLESVSWQGTADRIPIEIYMLYVMANIQYNYPKMKFSDPTVRATIIRRTMNKYRKKARRYYRSINLNKSYLGTQLGQIDSFNDLHKLTNNNNQPGKSLGRDKHEYITVDDLHKLYSRFINEYNNGILGKKYIAQYNGYVYKTDVFALGLIIKDMASKTGYEKHLKPLVIRMCAVDPDKRPIITDCVQYLDALLEPNPVSSNNKPDR